MLTQALSDLMVLALEARPSRPHLDRGLTSLSRWIWERWLNLDEPERLLQPTGSLESPGHPWNPGAAWSALDIEAQVGARRAQLGPSVPGWKAWSAYPPLELFLRCYQARACLAMPCRIQEMVVGEEGTPQALFWPGRSLLLLCLEGLRRLLGSSFGVSVDWPQASMPLGLTDWRLRMAHAGVGPLLEQLSSQALGAGFALWQKERARQQVSWGEYARFWSQTPAKQRSREWRRAFEAEQERLSELFVQWWRLATRVSWNVPVMALRQSYLYLYQETRAIHTQSGTSLETCSCTVMGQEQAREQLLQLRQHLESLVSWVESCPTLLRRLSQGDCRHPQLASLYAELQARGEIPAVSLLQELQAVQERIEWNQHQVEQQIGIWDRLNVFRATPEKEARSQLKAMKKEVDGEIAPLRRHCWEVLTGLRPELELFRQLERFEKAFSAIHARCISTEVERSYGKTERQYRCSLEGHRQALACLREWGATLCGIYPSLLSPCQWMEMDQRSGSR